MNAIFKYQVEFLNVFEHHSWANAYEGIAKVAMQHKHATSNCSLIASPVQGRFKTGLITLGCIVPSTEQSPCFYVDFDNTELKDIDYSLPQTDDMENILHWAFEHRFELRAGTYKPTVVSYYGYNQICVLTLTEFEMFFGHKPRVRDDEERTHLIQLEYESSDLNEVRMRLESLTLTLNKLKAKYPQLCKSRLYASWYESLPEVEELFPTKNFLGELSSGLDYGNKGKWARGKYSKPE